MIRINLVGTKAKPKSQAPKGQLFLMIGLILVEVIFLFVWYQMLSSDLETATQRSKDATSKISDLKKVKQAWEQWQVEKADLARQAAIFDTLRSDQLGPPNMLLYLSYVLTRVDDSPASTDEIKAQELVGWNPKWDPRRVWIRKTTAKEGIMTVHGDAIDHEDVAEFYRRLESSDYFLNVEPGLQARKISKDLAIKFVEFKVTVSINYRLPEQTPVVASAIGEPGAPTAPAGVVK